MATYEYSPPEKSNIPTGPMPSDGGVKNRIYQAFKPTLVLDELSLPAPAKESKEYNEKDTYAIQYPIVKINDYIFSKHEIDSLVIDSKEFLPTIQVSVTLTNELFLSKELPKDGDIISIAIRNKSDLINIIRNDYVITGVVMQNKTTLTKGPITMTFFGELFVPGLKSGVHQFGVVGTSIEFFKLIAQYLKLGFATNEQDTDDKQSWLVYQSPHEIIKETVLKIWKDKESFFDAWIDVYYNLNIVNINRQLLSSEDDIDIAASLSNVDNTWVWGSNAKKEDVVSIPKVFSNYIDYRNTSFYIRNWKAVNKSTAITFDYGTSIQSSLFEHNQLIYNEQDSQKNWSLDISPTYDKNKLNKYILLRGRAKWDSSTNTGELARANYNYADLYKKNVWMGIQYTLTNTEEEHNKWNGNHHKNYLRAYSHNTINLKELEKLNVEISVQGVNLNILKGDKVPIVLIKNDRVENKLVLKESYAEALDFFYTGYYMVKGFSLSYVKDLNDAIGLVNFSQTFILTRREWPTPVPIEPIK
jgi:hypothetical protein